MNAKRYVQLGGESLDFTTPPMADVCVKSYRPLGLSASWQNTS